MKNDCLANALKQVLFNNWNQYPSTRASTIISLCGYYGKETMQEAIQNELVKLISQQPMLLALETLLKAIENGRSNDFRWEPHFNHERAPESLTLNPTFNVQKGDDASIVAEIKEIRNELSQNTVDISLLISHIANMARESGDLIFDDNG